MGLLNKGFLSVLVSAAATVLCAAIEAALND